MDILEIDPTDSVILIIIFCFGLFSLFRGFIKELFSIVGWIVAILLAIFFTPFVLPKIQVVLPSISFSPLIVGILISLIVYILFRILGGLFQKKVWQYQYNGNKPITWTFIGCRQRLRVSLYCYFHNKSIFK